MNPLCNFLRNTKGYIALLSLDGALPIFSTPGSFRNSLRIVSGESPQASASSEGVKCLAETEVISWSDRRHRWNFCLLLSPRLSPKSPKHATSLFDFYGQLRTIEEGFDALLARKRHQRNELDFLIPNLRTRRSGVRISQGAPFLQSLTSSYLTYTL